ncbi:hypothetical protein ZIOFF_053474 [Zingiber officinale]|uniref:DYW domain-containing protein n=1 Tax=Zingiber officinale TaxID=94328 RepID=A0A8J5F832_ZINOF|nr:hypothetical protein ZIOFF_053474 [Zingiber officinale]
MPERTMDSWSLMIDGAEAIGEGFIHFEYTSKEYEISPRIEHYIGLIEVLGKSGRLNQALEFVENQETMNMLEGRNKLAEYQLPPKIEKVVVKEQVYVPDTRYVLHDIDQEAKEQKLLYHSERLAIAYGMISTSARAPRRIIKNSEYVATVIMQSRSCPELLEEFIVRDDKRFHHFNDGKCSCGDYWLNLLI